MSHSLREFGGLQVQVLSDAYRDVVFNGSMRDLGCCVPVAHV